MKGKFIKSPNSMQIMILGMFSLVAWTSFRGIVEPFIEYLLKSVGISNIVLSIIILLLVDLLCCATLCFIVWLVYCFIVYLTRNSKEVNG